MSKLWIARDKDGALYIFSSKPKKYEKKGRFFPKEKSPYIFWGRYDYENFLDVEPEAFPKVTWENSPKELIIKE